MCSILSMYKNFSLIVILLLSYHSQNMYYLPCIVLAIEDTQTQRNLKIFWKSSKMLKPKSAAYIITLNINSLFSASKERIPFYFWGTIIKTSFLPIYRRKEFCWLHPTRISCVLVYYYLETNYHQFSSWRQHPFISSRLLRVRVLDSAS